MGGLSSQFVVYHRHHPPDPKHSVRFAISNPHWVLLLFIPSALRRRRRFTASPERDSQLNEVYFSGPCGCCSSGHSVQQSLQEGSAFFRFLCVRWLPRNISMWRPPSTFQAPAQKDCLRSSVCYCYITGKRPVMIIIQRIITWVAGYWIVEIGCFQAKIENCRADARWFTRRYFRD